MVHIQKRKPMIPVMVRLAPETKEKAQLVAQKLSTDLNPITESDVYRTAISLFLEANFTDSKIEVLENSNEPTN